MLCASPTWSSASPTGTEALRGVSLEIEAGEFFGLLGPNGPGTSTLIHCATGLARPTPGEIWIFGQDAVDHYQKARQSVDLAPQEINLDWFLTLEETLDYHGGYFGVPKRERWASRPDCGSSTTSSSRWFWTSMIGSSAGPEGQVPGL